jgi:hypothetical protein
MTEEFISYLWTHQYFSKDQLCTSDGKPLRILFPGIRNHHQGPDFLHARLILDQMEWFGNIEIHIRASDWEKHHRGDERYNSTILHVVWEENQIIQRADESVLPCLSLRSRTDSALLEQCQQLRVSPEIPACRPHWPGVESIYWSQMMERCAVERLEQKSQQIQSKLQEHASWDELLWHLVARAIMRQVNALPMEQLLHSLPYKLLYKYRHRTSQLEALLLGHAGLLAAPVHSAYACFLAKEYEYLSALHQLPAAMRQSQWNFLRTRPSNFPSLRLVQLARILPTLEDVRSVLEDNQRLETIGTLLAPQASSINMDPYHFLGLEKCSLQIGQDTLHTLYINALVPWLVARSQFLNIPSLADQALDLLSQLPPESNKITRSYASPYIPITNALDTQGIIWLHNQYCQGKKCLSCRIGNKILNGKMATPV